MNIHDKAVKNMIESSSHIIEVTPRIEPTIVRICEICGGSTSSIDNHICENCREQIRKLFQEHRVPLEEAFIGYVEDTIDKYSTMDSIIDGSEGKIHVRYIKEDSKR